MRLFLLGILIFKLQTTVAQFPNHKDLQKVGEVIFNNEKYNVLKPTTHVITDYFQDFMLRRENANFPTKRVLIDKNGFRHAWSGFGDKVQSLRKTDLKYFRKSDTKPAAKVIDKAATKPTSKDEKAANKPNSKDDKIATKPDLKDDKIASKLTAKATDKAATKLTAKATDKTATQLTAKATVKTATKLKTQEDSKSFEYVDEIFDTVATISFYCPFLGLITMSTSLDDEKIDEN